MRMLDWVAIFGIWLIVWKISSARTSAFTFLVVFCLFYITNKYPKIYSLNWVQAAFKVITPVCAAISFVAVYLYRAKNSIGILINTLMSERINIISSFLDKYDLTLFGQELEIYTTRQAKFMGVRANPLDNAYARCLLMYGIIFFVFLCVAYTIFINRAMKSRMYPLVLMCTFFVFIGIGESYLLNPIFNITLLCLLNIAEFTSEQTEADTILKKKICLRFFKSPRRIWEKRL